MQNAANAVAPMRRKADTSLREALRRATADVHARLHRHRALAALQARTIDRSAYIALLERLYGFHAAYETAAGLAPLRTIWLDSDLAALGLDGSAREALPRCHTLPQLTTPAQRLGAAYVVEGSTLGGRELARALDPLLGAGIIAGRRFFTGYAGETGTAWRAFQDRLAAFDVTMPQARPVVVAAACATFAAFEAWMG